MTDKIDLHTHSTASDGSLTPSELAGAAKNAGLSAIALTDHDTIDGAAEFERECLALGIEGITGVEISAEYKTEMHIVGLFVDSSDKALREKLALLRNGREVRNLEMLRLLQKNGMDITEQDIVSQKDGATMANTGRAHIARAMLKKGYAASVEEAFVKFLKKGNCCYVKRITYSPEESVQLIKNAGGTAILAHPIYISQDYDELYKLIKTLKGYGLDGIECFYNSYSADFSNMCLNICRRLELTESGGSDFHGEAKPDVKLGRVSTGYIPYRLLLNMKMKRGISH